jgi:cytochrome c553
MWRSLRISLLALAIAGLGVAHGNESGKAKAAATCNVCHGANGLSQMPGAPHLAGQPEMYVREQLRAYRSGKRQNEVMVIIAKPLTDDEIADLAAWYASIEISVKTK